jgi:hypothetical protein
MQVITKFATDSDAQAARILLAAEGIDAEVQGELIGMAWNNAFTLAVVNDDDAERALELLKSDEV